MNWVLLYSCGSVIIIPALMIVNGKESGLAAIEDLRYESRNPKVAFTNIDKGIGRDARREEVLALRPKRDVT